MLDKNGIAEATQNIYYKVRAASFNNECCKRMLIVPNSDEIVILHWALQEYAKRHNIEL